MSPGGDTDAEPMRTDMLEYICGGSQSHMSIYRREVYYKIRDHFKQSRVK